MANYKGGTTTICPYYLKEAGKSITCQGAIEDCTHMQRFDTKQAKEKWQDKVCSTYNYLQCPVATMLEQEIDTEQKTIPGQSELDIYNFIVAYTSKNLSAPSIREIASATYYGSTKTIHLKLKKLAEIGLIEVIEHKKRSIKLIGYELVAKK